MWKILLLAMVTACTLPFSFSLTIRHCGWDGYITNRRFILNKESKLNLFIVWYNRRSEDHLGLEKLQLLYSTLMSFDCPVTVLGVSENV